MMSNHIKIVVVEDEPIILKNVIQKIESLSPVYQVVGSANNGKDALPIIERVQPDVLFTDIRMPVMDGLDLIRRVRESNPDMPIIILSGYNEFDYARQAMELNVKEYLLKPIKIESLEETLNNIRKKLESEMINIERDILFSDINGRPVSSSFPCSLTDMSFAMYLVCAGHLCNNIITSNQLKFFKDLWNEVPWSKILSPFLTEDEKWWVVDEKQLNQKFFLFSYQKGSIERIVPAAEGIKADLIDIFRPLPVNLCTVERIIPYTEIWSTAQELRIILDRGLIMGRSDVISLKNLKYISDLPPALDTAVQNRISMLLQSGSRSLLKDEFYSLFKKLVQAQYPQRLIEKALQQVIKLFHSQSLFFSDAELYHLEYELNEKLVLSSDFSSIHEDIWNIFESMLQYEYKEYDNTSELVDRIEDYLRKNYTDTISLEDISKKFNFNPSYLTKIFKKYKGETPVKYIITLRTDEAKRLIKDRPELDLKKIGEIVGYPDQHYFSRIFKNITGQTLSEYREQALCKSKT